MVPPARIERAASYFKNALSRLSYGGDGAREGDRLPDLRVTRAALYAELRGHDWLPAERIERPILALQNPCTSAALRRQKKSQTAGTNPAKRSLPETTVCRPTEGDQYRISGPSYVLAGTAILNS